MSKFIKAVSVLGLCFLGLYATSILAGAGSQNIGAIADNVTGTFKSLGKLMISGAYLAGFGLSIASLFKFKQHKDNPQQAPLGTAITMLIVGIALIFLPSIIDPAGESIFGSGATKGGFQGEGVDTLK